MTYDPRLIHHGPSNARRQAPGNSSRDVQRRRRVASLRARAARALFAPSNLAGAVQCQHQGEQADGQRPEEIRSVAATGIQGNGGQLPWLERIQEAFGRHDITTVNAHVGGQAREAAEAMGAEAYATGNDIAFRQTPSLHTAAHEAAHIVQQRAGVQLNGGVGQEGDAYERHADEVADCVVQGRSAEGLLNRFAAQTPATQNKDCHQRPD